MAELHVEPKRRSSLTWLWVVIVLLIIIGLIWFFVGNHGTTTGLRDQPPAQLAQHALAWARTLAA